MAANHRFSAFLSTLLTLMIIAVGQLLKEYLAASRPGTLIAGVLGSFVFVFALTAISNYKMASSTSAAKCGLSEAIFALLLAVCTTAFIHRIAITICVIFSATLLFLINGVSQMRYGPTSHAVSGHKQR